MKHRRVYLHTQRNPARPRGAGFTLIEMVVSLSVISIVFLAMGSVMLLASKALPTANASSLLALDGSDIAEQIVSELQTATSVSLAKGNSIVFTVPDRDNDGNDETIIYNWDAAAGSPLFRRYNGGAIVKILPSVYEFSLIYDTKTIPQPDLLVESAEVEFSSRATATWPQNYAVKKNDWIGQYFQPTLPAEAVSWKITRVLVMAQSHGPVDGETLIQLRTPQYGDVIPSSNVIEQVLMREAFLPVSYAWQELTFSTDQGLTPGEGLCLVLEWVMSKKSAEVLFDGYDPAGGLVYTMSAGWSWNSANGKSILHYVYGTYTTATPQPPIVLLKSATLTLNPGTTPESRVRTTVNALNKPQMP